MVYAGACTFNTLLGIEEPAMFNHIEQGHPEWGVTGEALRNMVETNAPVWTSLIRQFLADAMIQCQPTSVGHAIAIANLRRIVPALDYSIWLQ
jgi:hypothetical protein